MIVDFPRHRFADAGDGLKIGNLVTITTETKDDKEFASLIKLETGPQPDKKK